MPALFVQTPASLTGYLPRLMTDGGRLLAAGPPGRARAGSARLVALLVLRLPHYLRLPPQPRPTTRSCALAPQLARAGAAQGGVWGVAVWLFWGLGSPTTGQR